MTTEAAEWDPSSINIESRGEIIPVVEAATITQTLETLRTKYGDDAPAIDPLARSAQEHAWMSPTEAQAKAQVHCESERLLYPNRCIVIGVTGKGMALALYCADDKTAEEPGPPPKEEAQPTGKVDMAAKAMDVWYERYAKCNMAFRYKIELKSIEVAAYRSHIEQVLLHFVRDPSDAKRVLDYMIDQTRVDLHLRAVAREMGPLMSAQLKEDTFSISPRPNRPGAVTPAQGLWPIQLADQEPPTDHPGLTKWALHVCRGKAWKEQRKLAVYTWAKTAPLSALSDTHLVLFYQSGSTTLTHRLYSLCEEGGAIKLVAEQHWRAEALPSQMLLGTTGTRTTHGSLSLHGEQCALAMQSAVLIWKIGQQETEATVIVLDKREISAVQVLGDTLSMGTTLGECYVLNWRSAELLAYDALRGIEPIWQVRYRPLAKARFMLSVMGVAMGAPWDNKMMGMDRPVAMDTCGGLLYVVSKYGFINVFDMHTRRVCHTFPPPEASANTPLLQYCYAGVRATPDTLYVLHHGGTMRTIKLSGK